MLAERVASTIARYRMFLPGQRAGVAVSGGQDSVCLLHLLHELAPRLGLSLLVLHLDHGLRGVDSTADAEFVRGLAARLHLEAIVDEADLSAAQGNLEQAARHARLEFFCRQLTAGRIDRVATGHTLSDQAETVLFRLLRGSGTSGLAGIHPVTEQGLVRPLIEVSRAEVQAWLAERGIAWREDATNAATNFRRNLIRHDLLPHLEREYNPALQETLARTAACALDEEAWWGAEIEALVASNARVRENDVVVKASWLAGLHPAVGRRVVRRLIRQAKGDLHAIGMADVDRILTLAANPAGRGRAQARGVHAVRSFEWLRLAKNAACGSGNFCLPISVPCNVSLPGTRWTLSLEVIESARDPYCVYNSDVSRLDWVRVSESGAPLELRNWRAGDRYWPAGKTEEWKLKDLFQDARIPSWERCDWPALWLGGGIVWTRGFGPAAEFAAGPNSRRVLKITETSDLREYVVTGSDGASA
jgi:tRNA(Ile)-lysidine synthase